MITVVPSNVREVIVGAPNPATTFSCANTGYPATSTVWYFNGVKIDSSFTGIVFDNTMLAIADPQVSHSGVYQCFVSNAVSEDNAAWLLEVRAPGNIYAIAFVCMFIFIGVNSKINNNKKIMFIRPDKVNYLIVRHFYSIDEVFPLFFLPYKRFVNKNLHSELLYFVN